MKKDLLFSHGRIGSLRLKNRLVMPPMVRNYADANGLVTPQYLAHIASIAKGGVGMMILEASYIAQGGKGFKNQLGIHHNKTIPGLKKLANAAHKEGAKIGVQLYHGGRQTSSQTMGQQPVAPSALPDPTVNEMPRQLTRNEIRTIVKQFGDAALRAKKAGMDFVEIHGAHGYLITQFLSPFSNRRKDGYGGTFENRLRFLSEVYQSVRNSVEEKFPVTLRLSGDELVPQGIHIADTVRIAKKMEVVGIDALHISAGNYASYARGLMIPPMAIPDGPLVNYAAAVKKAVKVPVIAVAKIRDPKMAERVIRNGKADFVAIGRTLLADPQWPNKVKAGLTEEINSCIACNQGCISRLFAQQDVQCTVNAQTSREILFNKPKGRHKKVLIVGGGPAGMSAARTAAERGHKVILIEKSARLGGQLFAAAEAPHRQEWHRLRKFLVSEMDCWGVDVRLKTNVSSSLIKRIKPDAVIWAVGADPKRPMISGIDERQVMTARDVLEGRVKTGKRVIVAGGGCAGAQTAEYLASKKKKVTIIEATSDIAADAPVDERNLLLGRLDGYKVKILPNTKLMSIQSRKVIIENAGGSATLPADSVVVCLGSQTHDGIAEEVKRSVKKFITVGDAAQPRRVTEAVAEGAMAILKI